MCAARSRCSTAQCHLCPRRVPQLQPTRQASGSAGQPCLGCQGREGPLQILGKVTKPLHKGKPQSCHQMFHFLLGEQENTKKVAWGLTRKTSRREKQQQKESRGSGKQDERETEEDRRQKMRSSSLACQDLTTHQLPAQGK